MENYPDVMVVVLNYNGAFYLPSCLDALERQNYPREHFQVVVSDNGSSDTSLEVLKRYPWVRVEENGKNLGFARGNNVVMEKYKEDYDYIVLLNNDTVPAPGWLREMVRVAEEQPQAGIVSGHLQLFYLETVLVFRCETHRVPPDGRDLGVQFYEVSTHVHKGVYQYLAGFYGVEYSPWGKFRWSMGNSHLGVPVPPDVKVLELSLRVGTDIPKRLQIFSEDQNLLAELELSPGVHTYRLEIEISRLPVHRLEQNTGSVVHWDGSGQDRGTFARHGELFFERDRGQYARTEEVFAACGASMLMRKKMLEEVGLLDDDFFMYYEDTDLSWRARLRGWKVIYAAQALCRHIHCGTTEEWSPWFVYLTERNRLAMLLKNARLSHAGQMWGRFLFHTLRDAYECARLGPSRYRQCARQVWTRLRVILRLCVWLPGLLVKRYRIQRTRRVSPLALEKWFVA